MQEGRAQEPTPRGGVGHYKFKRKAPASESGPYNGIRSKSVRTLGWHPSCTSKRGQPENARYSGAIALDTLCIF